MSSAMATRQQPLTVEIRPGVRFPDWSVVRSETTKDALAAILGAFRAEDCWRRYAADEDLVRSAIIRHVASSGTAPSMRDLMATTSLPTDEIRGLLVSLRNRDLVVVDGEHIVGAYPLTGRKTEHEVRIGCKTAHAMCAVDALGVGAMLGRDVEIVSACRQCGSAITIATQGAGTALAAADPASAVVWSGIRADAGCAADTLCIVIAFFCNDSDLETWRAANQPHTAGYRLSLGEALQVGRAIFGPTLAGLDAAPKDRTARS